MIEVGADRAAKRREAVIAQRQPELQCPETARELDRLIEEREGLDRIGSERLRIIAAEGERPARRVLAPVEEQPAVERLVEPLVRIEREGVRGGKSPERLRDGEGREGAVGAVDMQPELLLAADGRDVGERIDCSRIDGAGGGDHGERGASGGAIGGDGRAQRLGVEAIVVARLDEREALAAESEQRHRLPDRHVRFARGVHDAGARARFVRRQARLAGHREPHQIRHRAAATQAPGEAVAAERAAETLHQVPLDRHGRRRRAPGGHVLIEHAREQIRERCDRLAGTQHVAVEARRRCARQREHLAEGIERGGPETLLGKRRCERARGVRARDLRKGTRAVERREQIRAQVRHPRGQGSEFGDRQMQGVHQATQAQPTGAGDTTRAAGL